MNAQDNPVRGGKVTMDRQGENDLYLIDRLLHMMVDHQNGGWEELERRYNATATAMQRLRLAFESGEMERIGLGLADYFRSTATKSV